MNKHLHLIILLSLTSFLLSCSKHIKQDSSETPNFNVHVTYMRGVDAYRNEDYQTALKLLTKAADQGFVSAQYDLGIMYTEGKGVAKDEKQASLWYTKAAVNGFEIAQLKMGRLHLTGEGVKQDYEKAAFWFLEASSKGNAEGQYNLGQLYLTGQGVEKDIIKAYAWFEIASQNGFTINIDDKPDSQMIKEQIEEGKNLISEMLEKNPNLLNHIAD